MKNKPMVIFVGCCLVPLIMAYLALKFEWISPAISNNGEFLTTEIKLRQWRETEHKQWTIALNHPQQCSQACAEQLSALDNLYVALGKNQGKVDMVILGEPKDTATPWRQLAETDQLEPASLYLIDHMGLVVLHYPYKQEPQQNRLTQKGLLKDLKKLLNYSRSS
ncbi:MULTISPECIES: transmembrane cytochrome oxidase associated protein [unclassified Pseudoalteromonas]|uniref:transmembrane cytochrome oxidase associated protein n=1 Tax=unclassified Pseudoalteromonas TaxID=194690 RepID=UPI000C081992|nr:MULTISPECIES: transmembrane cytochrome oxidase associated protein [unclassified Pseudoalteromonas]MDP2634226.1 transmembrane cytochrome oxidase associated protein [Pseudoalteromonas sp. 1_MG-2023]PHN90047.1 transmembrane cytochrome oxidase associated protein [Pseudoalteromonas sp. 3D05]